MYKHIGKRLIDLGISIVGLPFFLILFIFFAPMIKLTDWGPIFYNAERLGKNGKVFKMYKFRSMRINSPDIRNEDGSTYNGENDPRVTWIGRFMRKASVDEVPQILNVLKGDMSIIGPRPFVTTNYKGYKYLGDKERKRLDVRPGITGYSQAYFRNSIGKEEKIDNDCYYTEHVSLMLDLKIFFKTVESVIKRENIFVESGEGKK